MGFLADVFAHASDGDIAGSVAVGVAQGVVYALLQRLAFEGDSGHGLVHTVVDVAGLDAADDAVVERRVGGQGEDDAAEGRVLGDGDGECLAVLAADRAARDSVTRLCGHGGTREVLRCGSEGEVEIKIVGGDVGHATAVGENKRAGERHGDGYFVAADIERILIKGFLRVIDGAILDRCFDSSDNVGTLASVGLAEDAHAYLESRVGHGLVPGHHCRC